MFGRVNPLTLCMEFSPVVLTICLESSQPIEACELSRQAAYRVGSPYHRPNEIGAKGLISNLGSIQFIWPFGNSGLRPVS